MGIYTSKIHNDYPGTLPYPQILVDLIITKVMSFLSIIPSIIILISYFFIKKKNFQDTVALQLSISCLLHSVSFLFPLLYNPIDTDENLDCKFQASILTTFNLISLALTTSISYLAYKSFTEDGSEDSAENSKTQNILSIWLCWILPLIFGVLCFFYGENHSGVTLVCFPRNKIIEVIFLTISSCFFLCNMVCVFLLIKAVAVVLSEAGDLNKGTKMKFLTRSLIYFFSQAITYGPFLVDAIIKLIYVFTDIKPKEKTSFHAWWDYFRDFTQCGTGLVFAIVYGFTKNIRDQFACGCCDKISAEIYNDPSVRSSKSESHTLSKAKPFRITDSGDEILLG